MKLDLTGQRFGRLVVIREDGKIGQHTAWLCKCDCGNEARLRTNALRSGNTKSCGCYAVDFRCLPRKYPKPIFDEKLYKAWHAMVDRCNNPRNKNYGRYGDRGISVCKEWHDYCEFATWALNNGFSYGLSIDRIDNDGNYEPSNCRWTTMKRQQNNRSSNVLVEIDGKTKTISEWCDEYDINYNTVHQRMKQGMDAKTALTRAHKYRGYGIPVQCIDTGERFQSSKEAAEKYGVSLGMIAKAARTGCNACGMKWKQIYDEIPERKRCSSYRKMGAEMLGKES